MRVTNISRIALLVIAITSEVWGQTETLRPAGLSLETMLRSDQLVPYFGDARYGQG